MKQDLDLLFTLRTQVSIKDINPSIFKVCYLSGMMVLKWPYKPSLNSIAVLLADDPIEDIVKQVKVMFYGSAASFIARLDVGCHLDLIGEPEIKSEIRSSCKRIELHYTSQVVLRLKEEYLEQSPSLPAASSDHNFNTPKEIFPDKTLKTDRSRSSSIARRVSDYFGLKQDQQLIKPESSNISQPKFDHTIATNFNFYTRLNSLKYGSIVDLMAIVIETHHIKRARTGRGDYYISFELLDNSVDFAEKLSCLVFKPNSNSLPKLKNGDGILLRAIQIKKQSHRFIALSRKESAWAVLSIGSDKLSGPMVDIGLQEISELKQLQHWYQNEFKKG